MHKEDAHETLIYVLGEHCTESLLTQLFDLFIKGLEEFKFLGNAVASHYKYMWE